MRLRRSGRGAAAAPCSASWSLESSSTWVTGFMVLLSLGPVDGRSAGWCGDSAGVAVQAAEEEVAEEREQHGREAEHEQPGGAAAAPAVDDARVQVGAVDEPREQRRG